MKLNLSSTFLALFGAAALFVDRAVAATDLAEFVPPTNDEWMVNNDIDKAIRASLERRVNGGTMEDCNDSIGPKHISAYANELFGGLTDDEIDAYIELSSNLGVRFWFVFALVIFRPDPSDHQSFYPSKQQSKSYQRSMRDLEKFWDNYWDDTNLYALSTNLLNDQVLMEEVVSFLFSSSTEFAQEQIARARELFDTYPNIGYDFPIWTLNAFASPGLIALGDGLYKYLEWAGIDDAGPEFVLFHEFGHVVQFANFVDVMEFPKVELMADALAAYYGHHPRGATFQTKRLDEVAMAALNIGDCNIGEPGHHGTPNQRAAAARFAADLIDDNKKRGHILTSEEFINLFDAAYDDILGNR